VGLLVELLVVSPGCVRPNETLDCTPEDTPNDASAGVPGDVADAPDEVLDYVSDRVSSFASGRSPSLTLIRSPGREPDSVGWTFGSTLNCLFD